MIIPQRLVLTRNCSYLTNVWWVWLVYVGIHLNVTYAQEQMPTLVLSSNQPVVSAAPFLTIFEDTTRQLSLNQVISHPNAEEQFITHTTNAAPNFGRTRSAYWVRFTLINQAQAQWYLLSDALLGEDYQVYVLADNTDVTTQYAHPIAHYPHPVWSLTLPPNQILQIYIRVTNGDAILSLPIELLTPDAMLERSKQAYRLYTAVYASMLIMAAYNFFLFFALRESSYLLLVMHIMAMLLVMHITNPVFEGLAFLTNTGAHFFSAPVYLAVISLGLFTRQLLLTKSRLPSYDRWLVGTVGLAVVCIPITGWIPAGTILMNGVALGGVLVVFITSIAALSTKDRVAQYFFGIFLLVMLFVLPNLVVLIFSETLWDLHAFYVQGVAVGHVVFILLLSVLQTERIRLLRECIQRTQAASQAKSHFLAGISHELRTPINAVMGLNALLRTTSLSALQADYVSKLEQSSRHMSQLVGDVLDMAQIENNSLQLDYAPFQLQTILQQVHDLLVDQATQRGLQLGINGYELVPETLLGDRGRLAQVLINLLHNAIKYTAKGSVSLSIQRLEPIAEKQVRLRFIVQDTGEGIPREKLATIFDAFTQLEMKPRTLRDGVGLGLAISRNLVQKMGGVLTAESRLDQGSRFSFTLSWVLASDTPLMSRLPKACSLKGMRILLVDDDEINRFVGQRFWLGLGCQVDVAVDGKGALLHLQQHFFDLVLLDISLPEISGFEVLRWIRNHSLQPRIKVIALTAHAIHGMEQQCLDAGADGFIRKPFEWQMLCQVILKVLNIS